MHQTKLMVIESNTLYLQLDESLCDYIEMSP